MPRKPQKQPRLKTIVSGANVRGLFVLVEGKGLTLSYKFWDRNSGKCVLTYYPASGRWLNARQREGQAPDFHAALDAGLHDPPGAPA